MDNNTDMAVVIPTTSSESGKTVSTDEDSGQRGMGGGEMGIQVNFSECYEDREKLAMVLLQMSTARMNESNQSAMYDLDRDACLRTLRLIGNLEAYLKQIAEDEYADVLVEERNAFEMNIVHSCLVEVLPQVLERMMSNDCDVLIHAPVILCAWSKLYAAFLLARSLEQDMFSNGISNYIYEEFEACSTVMHMALDKGYVDGFLCGDEQHGGRDMRHIVGRCEHTDRLTDWVQVEYLRHVSEDEGRYLRAVVLDTFASARGIENLLLVLKLSPQLTIYTVDSVLRVLHACMSLISESKRMLVCTYMEFVCECFEAGFRLPGFEGFEVAEEGHPSLRMCSVLRMMYDITKMFDDEGSSLRARISMYQKETVTRLFDSENVSHQLSAVKALDSIVSQAISHHTFSSKNERHHDLPEHIAWIVSTDILSSMLKANLHHSQYIEDMQDLLRRLAIYGAVSEDHMQYLWSILDDEGTFEEIKCNVAQLLGSLASSMPEDNADELLCQKLADMHLSSSSIKYIGDLLTTASKYDAYGILIHRLMGISLNFALDDKVPENVGSVGLFLDVCEAYEEVTGVEKVLAEAIRICMSKITIGSTEDMTRPLQVMLHVFQGRHISRALVSQVYKELNPNAAFSKGLVKLYDGILENSLVGNRPNSESNREALSTFNMVLKLVLNDSDYYVSIELMKTMLGWTNANKYSHELNEFAWNLLVSLVQGEKGVQSGTLHEFLLIALHKIQARDLTFTAWRCITGFLASAFDYSTVLYAGQSSYTSLLELSKENCSMGLWDVVISFLSEIVVSCSNEAVAREASKSLSSILSEKISVVGDDNSANQVMESVERCKGLLHESYQAMFDAAIDEEIPWKPVSMKTFSSIDRLKIIKQLMKYFKDLIRAFAPKQLEDRPLDSSYKGDDVCICAHFQQLPLSPRASANQKLIEMISCPRNALVGDLRGMVSRKASHFVGYFIPQENFRLFQGGREISDNASSVSSCISGESPVMAVFTPAMPQGSMVNQCSKNRSRVEQNLANDLKLFKILISFADMGNSRALDFAVKEGHAASKTLRDISILAMDLLLKLPVFDIIGKFTLSEMKKPDIVDFKSFIGLNESQGEPNSAAMLYSCLILYSQMNPMVGDGRKSSEIIQHPLSFLQILQEVYQKGMHSNKGKISDIFIHLVQHISLECSESNDDLTDRSLHSALLIVTDCTHNSEKYSAEDLYFISCAGLEVILRLCNGKGELEISLVGQLIQIFKRLLGVKSDLVRSLAVQEALSFSVNHGLERRFFKEVARDIILAKNPSREETAFCVQLVENSNGMLNDEMVPLAIKLCECIENSLSEHEPIENYSRSLHFALQNADIGMPTTMKPLFSKIISEYLFPEIKLHSADDCCAVADKGHYVTVVKNGLYSLREQENLYRILLSCALAFDDCWQTLHAELVDAFDKSKRGFPRLYNNTVQRKVRDMDSYCGLLNGGATCYMNATFQQLYMQPNVRKNILLCLKDGKDSSCPVLDALGRIFLQMSGGLCPAVDPSIFWKVFKDYDGNPVNVQEHQDAYEFFTRLQDTIDEHLKATGQERVIYSVLGGSFNQIIEVPGHDGLRSEREEEFYQISLDVRGKENLTQSLESYVAVETLDAQNQWFCEELGRKVDAKKRTLLKRLPETLVLHFKRFEWDFETLSRWKIKDRFEFPLQLDMKPYVDASHANDNEDYLYDLSGIIIHSGTAFAGHYYSYAKDRSSGEWFCFDDDTVTPWDISNIDRDCFGGLFTPEGSDRRYQRNHSAYMLMYDRLDIERKDNMDFLDLYHLIPAEKRTQMVLDNFMELNRMHAFHPALANFILMLAREMSVALDGPRALKSKRVDGSAGPNMHMRNEIFYQHDRREDKASESTVRQTVSLCIKYICQVYIFSPFDGSNEKMDPILEMIEPLTKACSLPSVAQTALEFFTPPQNGQLSCGLSALESPYKSSRVLMSHILAASVRSLSDGMGCMENSRCIIARIIESIIGHVRSSLANYPSATVKWKDMIGILYEMRSIKNVERVLLENIVELVSFSESIFHLWRQFTRSQRQTQDFADPYLGLVLPLLRMHRLPSLSTQDKDLQMSNPFILRLSSEQRHIDELPSGIFTRENSACLEAIRFYLLPGKIETMESILFMKWFAWENLPRSNILVAAILLHIQDSSSVTELASEASSIVNVLVMEDSNAVSRILGFVLGFVIEDMSLPEQLASQSCTEVPGLMDSCLLCRNAVKTYLMTVILLGVLKENPNAFASVYNSGDKFSKWAAASLLACNQISERLAADNDFRTTWISLIPSDESSMCTLFDPNQLSEQLGTILQSKDPSSPLHQPADMIEAIDADQVVCIKADHEGEGHNIDDDVVAEIDVEENP